MTEKTVHLQQAIKILSEICDNLRTIGDVDRIAALTQAALLAEPDGQLHVLQKRRMLHGALRLQDAVEGLAAAVARRDVSKRAAHFSPNVHNQSLADQDEAAVRNCRRYEAELRSLYREPSDGTVFLPLGALVRLRRDQVEDEFHSPRQVPLKAGATGVVIRNNPEEDWPVRIALDQPVPLAAGSFITFHHAREREFSCDAADLEVLALARTLDGATSHHLIAVDTTRSAISSSEPPPHHGCLLLKDGVGRVWAFSTDPERLTTRSVPLIAGERMIDCDCSKEAPAKEMAQA